MLHKSIITKDKTIWKYYIVDYIYIYSNNIWKNFIINNFTTLQTI